jgi:hypothetical protein
MRGSFPGHAVTVVAMAEDQNKGRKVFLLAQSFLPAQDIHVLKNRNDKTLSPWYDLNFEKTLEAPEWTFNTKLKGGIVKPDSKHHCLTLQAIGLTPKFCAAKQHSMGDYFF